MDAEVVVLMRQARLVVIIPPHGPVMHDFCLNSIDFDLVQARNDSKCDRKGSER